MKHILFKSLPQNDVQYQNNLSQVFFSCLFFHCCWVALEFKESLSSRDEQDQEKCFELETDILIM